MRRATRGRGAARLAPEEPAEGFAWIVAHWFTASNGSGLYWN